MPQCQLASNFHEVHHYASLPKARGQLTSNLHEVHRYASLPKAKGQGTGMACPK